MESQRNRKRYIIIHDDKGVFLGTYSMADILDEADIDPTMPDEELYKSFALFADENPFPIPRAVSFSSEAEAKQFCEDSFSKDQISNMSVVCINSESQYPDVADIVKSGFGDYTFNMLDGLECPNEYVH